jgi:integrase
MKTHSPANERIKRRYVQYLKEVRGSGPTAIDQFTTAIHRFETYTKFADFGRFHIEQVRGFKQHLTEQIGVRSKAPLSHATVYTTLNTLKAFFMWLAAQPGFKSRFRYGDSEYFNPSRNTTAIAKAHRTPRGPTVDQIRRVLAAMPADTDVQRRDRAIVGLIALTAARVDAVKSLKLRNIDIDGRVLLQDARNVTTKFRKTFDIWFVPLHDEIEAAVVDWVRFLVEEKQWSMDAPLFPATKNEPGPTGLFEPTGLTRKHWGSTGPIRAIFRAAFERAGVPYFNPHSFRNTLVAFSSEKDLTWQEMQAVAQNLGHKSLTTTFGSYGQIPAHQQGDLVRNMGKRREARGSEMHKMIAILEDIRANQAKE